MIDADEILECIVTVQEENLKRLEDIDILKAYLKTQHAPKASIEALEGLTVEQHVSWKKAVDRIKKLLEKQCHNHASSAVVTYLPGEDHV
jgi:allantoicase